MQEPESSAEFLFMRSDQLVFRSTVFENTRRDLHLLSARANVPIISFHNLRHTFASCLAMAGVDLMLIQKLMRHKSYEMTLRYAHLHPNTIKGVTDVLVTGSGAQLAHKMSTKEAPVFARPATI